MDARRYLSRILLPVFIGLTFSAAAFAGPEIRVLSYNEIIDFSDEPVVLIRQGDSPDYKKTGFDDRAWSVTSLPSDWSDLYPDYNGVVWYRIHVNLPGNLPVRELGLRLGVITDADEVFFNGRFIGGSGRVDEPFESAYDRERLYEIPSGLIIAGGENIIAIRVRGLFSYINGPYSGTFAIGSHSELQENLLFRDYLSLFPVILYVIVAAYFMLFFIRRPTDRANLIFSLFSLAMGAYFALRTQMKYQINLDFFVAKKIEYLILATLAVSLTEFLTFYLRKRHTLAHYLFLGLAGIHFMVFLVTKDYVFWDTYNQYVQIPSWLLGVVLMFTMLIGSYREDRDARLMLYALIVLFLGMINDVLVNMAIYDLPRIASYAFVFFVAAIAAILSNRFVRLHGEVEDLNRNLERRVKARTEELSHTVSLLEDAKAETDNLLNNVQEGIFLLDHDYIIGDNHSKMLESIFERTELGGVEFGNLVREVIDEKTAVQTREFLDIALTKKLSDKRLGFLNPIGEIQAVMTTSEGGVSKNLRINFTRIGNKGAYTHLLGTVQDITEAKKFEQQVKRIEEQSEQEMKLIFGILHLSPMVVRRFLDESRSEIAAIEKTLESAKFAPELTSLLDTVFRSVHSIKGDASVLGLEYFTQQAHNFEERIRLLFDKADLTALDLLDLLYAIVDLKGGLAQVEEVLKRISGFHTVSGSDINVENEQDILIQTTRDLVRRVAERESKDVRVDFEGFTIPADDSLDHGVLKKVLIQIVKNAVSHGIESAQERKAAGKPEQGTITLEAASDTLATTITVTDDGRGLQLDAIRKRRSLPVHILRMSSANGAQNRLLSLYYPPVFLPGMRRPWMPVAA